MTEALIIGPDRTGREVYLDGATIAAEAPVGAGRIACPDGKIAPGEVCAHTHLYSGLVPYDMPAPSRAPARFIDILERVWWRLDRALDAESLAAAAADYVAKALLAGTTSLIDHHESPNLIEGSLAVLAEVCERMGMRALLCYGATERNFGPDEGRRGLAECARLEATPLVRPLVGLHAGFTVSDDIIREAGALARRLGTVLHVHLAEDTADVEDAKARGYDGPLERLIALDALVPGSILAHGVHLSAAQVRRVAEKKCWLVHNPRSNEGNRVGYAIHLSAARDVALGTDGWDADMAVEEAALFRLAKSAGDQGVHDRLAAGQRLIAERYGATAAGLAPGAPADLVIREGGRVRHVLVAGRPVVADGRLLTGDIAAIKTAAACQAARLWDRMAAL